MMATVTVMRSRFRSTTVEPCGGRPDAAPEHVGQSAALAAVHEDEEDQARARRNTSITM